ncbi:MAG: endonuclease [Phycisphaerae bacterium]|nr:hypothetical protein [Tepidisphaeraceae bacterium]
MTRAHRTAVLLLLLALPAFAQPVWKATAAMPAPEANQAAAADERFVYAIGSATVVKYDRKTGERAAVSTGKAKHLNSGMVHEGKLYCAHSNFPAKPESSQVYVMDPATMKLEVLKDFGNYDGGSLTWVLRDPAGGGWWCNFAKYDAENAGTFLVKFDEQWKELARYTYPPELFKKLGAKWSLSGGVWRDGDLLTTGHDALELYRLRLPKQGTVIEWVETQKAPFTGQGIAHDPVTGGLVGIRRNKKEIVFAGVERDAK